MNTDLDFEYKIDIIENYIHDSLNDCEESEIFVVDDDGVVDTTDLHQKLFNTTEFIDDHSNAVEWIKNDIDTLLLLQREVITFEREQFGHCTTDITDLCAVINMYVYIVGYDILPQIVQDMYDKQIKNITIEKLHKTKNEPQLVEKIKSYL